MSAHAVDVPATVTPPPTPTAPGAASLAALASRWQRHGPAQDAEMDAAWTQTLAAEAHAALAAGLDWPGPKAEGWRHTRLGPWTERPWQPAATWPPGPGALAALPPATAQALAQRLAELPTHETRLVFVNGQLVAAQGLAAGDAPAQDGAPVVCNLRDAATRCPAALPSLGALALHRQEAFAALNTTQLGDGALVYLPRNAVAPHAIELVYATQADVADGEQAGGAPSVLPRTLVVLEANAQATVSEVHLGRLDPDAPAADTPAWTNAVTELVLGDNAQLHYAVLQHEAAQDLHLAAVGALVGANAELGLYTFDDGSKLSRRLLDVRLMAQGANARLGHVSLCRQGNHQATHATVQHVAGHTQSQQIFKTAVRARSSSAFAGRVDILPNAPKASAQQMSRGLLLDGNAQAYLQPQLQILTDDVRCAHGATVGSLSQEAKFYLMSRGLSACAAEELLTFAFLEDALAAAPAHLQPVFAQRTAAWLGLSAAQTPDQAPQDGAHPRGPSC